MNAEPLSVAIYLSKNVISVLFYASEQTKVWKMWAKSVHHLSRLPLFCPQIQVGLTQYKTVLKSGGRKIAAIYSLIVDFTDIWAFFFRFISSSISCVNSEKSILKR